MTLKTAKQFFCMTLWLMMLHHHTKFGIKMICGSEDIILTNIHNILNLCCDLDLEHSNQMFAQDAPTYDGVPSNQVSWVATGPATQKINYSRNSHILII